MTDAPCPHSWVEVSAFAGLFCAWCGADYDDLDANPRPVVPRGVALP